MYISEGNSGNVPSIRGLRFKRILLFVLAICLVQVKKAKSFTDHASQTGSPQAFLNQSLNASAVLSTPLAIPRKDGLRTSKTHFTSERQGPNHVSSHKNSKKTHVTVNKRNGVPQTFEDLNNSSFSTSSLHSSTSTKIKPLAQTSISNDTYSFDASKFPLENITHSSDDVTHLYNKTHSLNYSKNPPSSSLTSRGNLSRADDNSTQQKPKKGGTSIVRRKLKLLSNRLRLPRHGRKSDTSKSYIKYRKKKRRKYSSHLHSNHHHHTHHRHRHRKANLERRKSVVSGESKFKENEFTKRRRRSLQLNRRYPLFRVGSERVLLRFKRKSLLDEDDEEKPSEKSGKRHKRKKRRQVLPGRAIKPRSVPVILPINGLTKGNYPRSMVWKRPSLTNPLSKSLVTNSNGISQATYDPLIYGGRSSSLSQNPYRLPSNPNEYNGLNSRKGSVPNMIKPPPSAPISSVNIGPKNNQFAKKGQAQLATFPFRSEARRPEIVPAWNTFQGTAMAAKMNIRQPVKVQYGNQQPQRSGLIKNNIPNKKQFIPASQPVFYGSEHQTDYQPQFVKSQMAFTGGNTQNAPYPQTGPNNPRFFSQERARMNPLWSSVQPATNFNVNNHASVENDVVRRSRVSQGLLIDLNFDDVKSGRASYASLKGDVTDTDKRTEITKFFGSCGKVARLNNGSEILLNGGKLKVKPRQAISIAAWIKLDSNKGYHSIFDTVGGHSLHQNGQYHFEIQDGSVRWFHRNESEAQIFSVETDPIIPATVWNHIVGTYTAHTGIAKVFVNGRLKAEAAGKGLLSQDWDAHAGIGKHKDERFLQGEVDEFRIYNKALSQDDIQNLMKICSFERECGGFFYSPTGIFESPEWPKSYKGKTSCTWHVKVDPSEKIALSFKSFSLDQNGTCDKAKLVVKDGSSKNANALGVYCGVKRPPGITSSGNHLWLQFTSTEGAEGKGFLLSYDTATSRQTKKTERPPSPVDDSQRCAVTRPEYNVTLLGGIKSGIFSEAKHVHDMDLCTRHCCLRKSCDLAFMIRDSCYLVHCGSAMVCKTKKARPSSMNPRITFVSHLQAMTAEPELSADGSAFNKAITPSLSTPTTRPVQPMCHHTAVSYNVTLVGGINAGKFSTYGKARNMDECIRHCCRDDKCDVSFMIQGNCYAVECADTEGCQVKRAKPSAYNPTVAYVYRGNQRPIGDPLPGAEKPSLYACDRLSVSNIIYNVTLRGGIKAGNFTDKGVVKHMDDCSAFCCADERCNVAFLIRDNCFLVACKDYGSCQMKPALSEYYHPRLTYVNWSPPDDEIPANRWYAALGCWKDTESVAVATLEGSDALLTESYATRLMPIDKCAQVARKHEYKVFAIQNGGACLSGPTAGRMFNQFGESSSCKAGKGGLFANDVYRLTDAGSYVSLGCWNDSGLHSLPLLEHSDTQLGDFYKSRLDPLRKCGAVARKRGYAVFALQQGGMCFGGPRGEIDYRKYGMSRGCHDGLGGPYANSVYRLIDNLDLEVGPTESSQNSTSSTGTTGSTGSSTSTVSSVFTPTMLTGTQGTPATSPSPTPHIQEHYLTLQDGLPHKNTYTSGEILFNVTLKYGIKAGKFNDKGKVGNMSECVRACGRMETCSLAFKLGKQCFAVACHNDALCLTKPAFSPFYKPQIAYVKHTKVIVSANTSKPSSDFNQCRASAVHDDVTLVGGINAGKFTDLGDADNMSTCTQRCCMKDACDVAFMLEGECYGVSCINESLCESRPARNPARYNPKIAYVYHDNKKDKASPQQKNVCWDGEILHNYTLVGGINAGSFSDNGKTSNMDICMQFCCKREACDLAFMIEDDCYSVACNSNGACEPRKARPTHYFPRIAIRKKPQGDYNVKVPFDLSSTPATSSSPSPTPSPSQSSSLTPATSPSPTSPTVPETHEVDVSVNPPVKVAHSCDATPIEYNVTLKMGLHSGAFQKIGRVDAMDDCIEMSCKQPNSDVAFMLGSMCYAVHCYSADLCKTVPIFGSSISRLNLNPAISFLHKRSRFGVSSLAVANDNIGQDKCRDSTITYNVTLRGGIDAGNFTERAGILSMRDCIGRCCDDMSCDLAFMFGAHCYSVQCQNEKLCQAVLAKPSQLEPKVSYVSRGFFDDKDKGTMFSASDQTPTCRADQRSRSKTVSNKTLVGGLEAGKFSFVGVVRNMDMCMDRCCAQRGCNLAYMVDRNCFSVACFSPSLCKISDVSSTNGDVEISTIMASNAAETPAEKHSMVVYVIIGVVGFAAGAGGILWAVCMFIRRHRLRSRHRQETE